MFFSDGGMVELAGTDADRVLNAMEDFAGYHRPERGADFASPLPKVLELRPNGVLRSS